MYAQGASPLTNLAQHHATDINVPIGCAEVAIYPGDVMVGDEEGVVCVPAELAEEVAEAANEQDDWRTWIQARDRGRASRCAAPIRPTRKPSGATTSTDRRGSHTRTHLGAPPRSDPRSSKLRHVLKRTSSPLNSHAAAATALSPAVDARGLGSAANSAHSVGTDPTGAIIF